MSYFFMLKIKKYKLQIEKYLLQPQTIKNNNNKRKNTEFYI